MRVAVAQCSNLSFLTIARFHCSQFCCPNSCYCGLYQSFDLLLFVLQSLTFVGFNSSSLTCLSLVGCRAVTLLELSCPNLQKVNLAGCDHLEHASFCPVSGVRASDI